MNISFCSYSEDDLASVNNMKITFENEYPNLNSTNKIINGPWQHDDVDSVATLQSNMYLRHAVKLAQFKFFF